MASQEGGTEAAPLVVDVGLIQILLDSILIHRVLSLNKTTPTRHLGTQSQGRLRCPSPHRS